MKSKAILIFILCIVSSGWSVKVLWAGLTLARVPTFEKEFERLFRENLQVSTDVQMIDNEAASRLRQKIDFDEFSAISLRLVEKVMHYIPDSTVIVWGRITDYSLEPQRSGFFWMGARVQGTITIALNVYSLRFQRYAYAGDITCRAAIGKGAIWFYPLSVAVQISAEDRARIMNNLQHDAAARCASMVSAVIRSEVLLNKKVNEIEGMERYEEPTIQDLFNIPSVEAESLPDSLPASEPAPVDSIPPPGEAPLDSTAAAPPESLGTPGSGL